MNLQRTLGFGSALLLGLLATGCGSGNPLLPLREGNEWTYSVKTTLSEFISKVKVTGRVPVYGANGFELSSTMGVSRFVWKGDVLYASAISGTRFHPPLPLLRATEEKHSFRQEAKMYSGGKTYDVDATIDQETQPYTRGGRRFRATVTTALLRLRDREIEIRSVYAPGIGLLEQVQRTRSIGQGESRTQFDLQLDCISGP